MPLRTLLALFALVFTSVTTAATPAQNSSEAQIKAAQRRAALPAIVEGEHFKIINPAGRSDQPQVVEFFSYTCPHCRAMEGFLATWKGQKPSNVRFQRMHVVGMFGAQGELLSKAFYTAEVLGISEKIHQPFFDLIHLEHKMPTSEQDVANYFSKFGVKADVVLSTMESFPVKMKLGLAKQAMEKYRLRGVPGFIINDKYFADGSTAKNTDMLDKILSDLPLR